MLLKKDLMNAIKTDSDVFKLGELARLSGKSEHFNPFEDSAFSVAWLNGWHHQNKILN